jgi:hypothetical protein
VRRAQPETSPYTKWERRGSAIAHASALLIGVPLTLLLLPVPLSLVPCPVVSYLIARSFRRRKLGWGAFQGMQASLIQLLILALATITMVGDAIPPLALTFGTAGFLVFLYSLWGAVDTLFGYDFHYVGISNLLEHVSRTNLNRRERRGRWFGGRSDKNNTGS